MLLLKKMNLHGILWIQSVIIIVLLYRYMHVDADVFETNRHFSNATRASQDPFSRLHTNQLRSQIPSLTNVNVSKINLPVAHVPDVSGADIYRQRIDRAKELCERYVNSEFLKSHVPHGAVWSYGRADGIHYCIVPKVGCTYWKRMFRFLNKDYPQKGNISRPSDIDRNYVHYGKVQNTNVTNMSDRVSMQLFSGGKMFMFSRDPYSRIWSAYIDKFLLPDFWRTDAIDAMRKVRENVTQQEIKCPKDITFFEYIKYIIKTKNSLNEHWNPIFKMCSPCHVQYDVIGKQETAAKDSKYILNRYGLENLIEETTPESRVLEETSMLIEYNFKLENSINKGCFEKLDVASRLWTAFKYNGYIHRDTPFPEKSLNVTSFNLNPQLEFSKLLLEVVAKQHEQGQNLKPQKRDMMVEAYRQVPVEVLKELQDIYRFDFEFFDYEMEPKDIYLR